MLKEIGQIRFWPRFLDTVKPPAAQAVATGARHARGGYPGRRARRSVAPVGLIIRPTTWAWECAVYSPDEAPEPGSPRRSSVTVASPFGTGLGVSRLRTCGPSLPHYRTSIRSLHKLNSMLENYTFINECMRE
jgi:hypothetical protein